MLTVTGDVENPASYTLENIKSFPQLLITTNTPWTNEAHTYKGPKLEDILNDAKAKGTWLTLKALDKYEVTLDFEHIRQFAPILAWEDNGKKCRFVEKAHCGLFYRKITMKNSNLKYLTTIWCGN